MARILAIEWDHQQLRVVEAAARVGKVEVRRACAWSEAVHPNPVHAEEAGKRLRERLKEAGIAPAPVYFAVGRDRLLFREVRYPDVPAAEVPAVVHFQASKELNFPAEEAVIDYALNGVPGPLGEKRALAVVLRKELLAAIQKTCKVAGLKLEGVAARPFAVLAGWQAQASRPPATEARALLVLNGSTGEFCAARGRELLFSRQLSWDFDGPGGSPNGSLSGSLSAPVLIPELRRTLAAYTAQYLAHPLQTLHLAGAASPALAERLASGLRVTVEPYDPTGGVSLGNVPDAERTGFAGVLGLAQAALSGKRPAVDFLKPKEAHPKDPRKKRYALAAAAAGVLLVLGAAILYGFAVSARNERIEELQSGNARLVKQIGGFGDVDKRMERISEWAGGEMVVLDELYDLVAHFPSQPGVRITKVEWKPLTEPGRMGQPVKPAPGVARPVAKPAGEKPIGNLVIEATGDNYSLDRLKQALEAGRQWKIDLWDTSAAGQVKATLKVFRQKPSDYKVSLTGERGGRP